MVHQPYGIMLFVNRKEWLSVIDPTIFLEVAGFLRAEDRRCIVRDGAFDARMLSSTRPIEVRCVFLLAESMKLSR